MSKLGEALIGEIMGEAYLEAYFRALAEDLPAGEERERFEKLADTHNRVLTVLCRVARSVTEADRTAGFDAVTTASFQGRVAGKAKGV